MLYFLAHDENSCKLITYALEQQNFHVECFLHSSALHRALSRQLPDLLLLALPLPTEDGLQLLRALRTASATRTLPIILLSDTDSEYERIIALDSGADDFLSRPFSLLELAARIRAVLRRTQPYVARELTCGPLRVCPLQRRVQVAGEDVSLTNKEFALLCLLIENQSLVLPRATLMDRVWGVELDRETRTLDVHIRALRAKLGPAGNLIQTVRGIGYRLDSI